MIGLKPSELDCHKCFSPRLAKLLCNASDDQLNKLIYGLLEQFKKLSLYPIVLALIDECQKLPDVIAEDNFMGIAEVLFHERELSEVTSQLDVEDTILEACWAFGCRIGKIRKVDGMLYQIQRFETELANSLLDKVLIETIGWSSSERISI